MFNSWTDLKNFKGLVETTSLQLKGKVAMTFYPPPKKKEKPQKRKRKKPAQVGLMWCRLSFGFGFEKFQLVQPANNT